MMKDGLAKSGNVIAREVAGENLLIPVCGKLADLQRIFAVNPVAKFVWDHLDGRRGPEALAAAVAEEFDVAPDAALTDVRELLGAMLKEGLISKAAGDD